MRWLPCLSNFLRANGAFTSAVALACCAWPLASAQPGPVAPIDFTFDAGFACPGFPLRVQTFGGRLLTFNRATGGTVTVIQSGTFVVYTNTSTGATFEQHTAGSVTTTTPVSSSRVRAVSSGGNSLIFFPTDSPPTSTIYYLGRVTYFVDQPGSIFTLAGSVGKRYDVCAELAG